MIGLLAGMIVLTGPQLIYGETVSKEIESVKADTVSNLSYCEFVRSMVVEILGEQPQIMDTHYALPYMEQAEELNWIPTIPMEQWNEKISYEEMEHIIEKLDENQQKAVRELLNRIMVDTISINGEVVELQNLETTVRNGNVMIPLRKVAETLGFKVTWQADGSKAELDNGEVKTVLQVGYDYYYMASSKAIGLTQAVQYGTPPMFVEGTVYVPAQVFNLLFSNPDTVAVNNGILTITTK